MGNSGIIISGGSINAQQLAIGHGSALTGTVNNHADERQLVDRLDELIEVLRAAELSPPRRHELVRAVEYVKEQAVQPEPDRAGVAGKLAMIERATASLSNVMSVLKMVRHVAAPFFGL